MSFKILLNIDQFPRIRGKLPRLYAVKPFYELARQVDVRQGMSEVQAAAKLGVGIERLQSLGITEGRIDTLKLRRALIRAEKGPEGLSFIKLREDADPMVGNVFNAIVGRLGEEAQV